MRIESKSGNGDFKLVANEETLCILNYENWFSSRATTELFRHKLEIHANNIWASKFIISRNKDEIGEIVFNWKGDIIVTYLDEDFIQNIYKINAKGLWKLRFEVFDREERLIFIMAPISKWNKLNYDYEIEFSDIEKPKSLVELLIYCGYAANLYVEMIGTGG